MTSVLQPTSSFPNSNLLRLCYNFPEIQKSFTEASTTEHSIVKHTLNTFIVTSIRGTD